MKRLILITAIVCSFCVSASAQHNLRTGYFLDGYIYKHKLNPAFGGDRGYFAAPFIGYFTAGAESNLSLSTLLYPTGNGTLTTFLSPSVSAEEFMSRIHNNNPLNFNTDFSLISLGFNAGKSFNTIDLSLKTDMRANVPGALFSWAKKYGNNLDMSSLGLNADARLELSYGYSRSIGDRMRFGIKVKFLAGLANANYAMDRFTLAMNEDKWVADALGNGFFSVPGVGLTSENGIVTGIDSPDLYAIKKAVVNSRNLGGAVDLGVSMDLVRYLTVSASITDLGFINWTGTRLGSNGQSIEYAGIDNIGGEGADVGKQFEELGSELIELISPKILSHSEKLMDMLSMTAHLGVEMRMPFWQRLSAGALGTYRFDGPYSWWEARGSLNLALFRWFSMTGSYAYSTFGESYGAAVNFHPRGINLFVGIDSYKPLLNVSTQYIPIDSFNTNLAIGLNVAFGKYRGRFPKKIKADY